MRSITYSYAGLATQTITIADSATAAEQTAAIQTALDTVAGHAGGKVALSAGTFSIAPGPRPQDGALKIGSMTELYGAGLGVTVLQLADGTASVTGGFVYRGRALGSAFQGRYFFADYVTGRIWSMGLTLDSAGDARAVDRREMNPDLGLGPVSVSSFGVDAVGELFILNHPAGTVLRVTGPPIAPPTPTGLSIVR